MCVCVCVRVCVFERLLIYNTLRPCLFGVAPKNFVFNKMPPLLFACGFWGGHFIVLFFFFAQNFGTFGELKCLGVEILEAICVYVCVCVCVDATHLHKMLLKHLCPTAVSGTLQIILINVAIVNQTGRN